jgi:hypothetical protein
MSKKLNVLLGVNLLIQATTKDPTDLIHLQSETPRLLCMDSEAVETIADACEYILPEFKDMFWPRSSRTPSASPAAIARSSPC